MRKSCWLLLSLLLLVSCSEKTDHEFQERFQLVKNKIKVAEQRFGKNDPATKNDVKQWQIDLKEIERYALETSESEAIEKLEHIKKEIALILENRDGDLKIRFLSGIVSLSGITASEGASILEGQMLKSGPNSTAEIRLYVDSSLFLLPGTLFKVKRVQPWSRSFIGELLRGGIIYRQKGSRSKFYLKAGTREFDQTKEGFFEVQMTGRDKGFVVPKKGNIHVVYQGKREKVLFGEGMIWSGAQSKHIQPLQAPEALSPQPEKTFLPKNSKNEILVDFEWTSVDQADSYFLDIYTDKKLSQPWKAGIQVQKNRHTLRLPKGVFFWRVKAVNKDHFPGYTSKAQWFSVVTDQTETVISSKSGPVLKGVKIQIMNDMAIVTGKVSDKASVTVNQTRAIRSMDGSFEVVVNLEMGEQWITVVATGQSGGQTIEKYKVNPDF